MLGKGLSGIELQIKVDVLYRPEMFVSD